MNRWILLDLGSGYIKYGTPWIAKPNIRPACYPARGGEPTDPKLRSLDPGRKDWVFPLECGVLPDASLLSPLLEGVLQPSTPELKKKEIDMSLLLFPDVDPRRASSLCLDLQETLGCRSVTPAIQQILSLAYVELHSGIIVDVGYSVSFVVPIYQGFLLREYVAHLATGSFFVSVQIRNLLKEAAKLASPPTARIYRKLAETAEAINAIKRRLLQVASDPDNPSALPKTRILRYGDLDVKLGRLVWQAPEVLFQPRLMGMEEEGLAEAVTTILRRVSPDVRAELASNILIAGGGAMIPGLRERMVRELEARFPYLTVKVFVFKRALFSAWLGAASLVRKGVRLPWLRFQASRM